MRLAMAQMQMAEDIDKNLKKSVEMIKAASEGGADFIFFPEIQLSPFFPKYENRNAEIWCLTLESKEVKALQDACVRYSIWASPNIYLEIDGNRYDASLMIDDHGEIRGISKMVNIYQAESFYERDYYTPSDTGFKVYDTPFGKIGIVICFDRHIPSSMRSCATQGADLVIIPTANLTDEPMELFEWEIRVQSFQNTVFAAMCNRIGNEDDCTFAGQSLVAGPDGSLIYKAGADEMICFVDISFDVAYEARKQRAWLQFE